MLKHNLRGLAELGLEHQVVGGRAEPAPGIRLQALLELLLDLRAVGHQGVPVAFLGQRGGNQAVDVLPAETSPCS